MFFEGFSTAYSVLLWGTFGIALILGAVVNKTNFCTMGAVSDMVNMGDYGRIRAWLLAIAIALLGVVILESAGMVKAENAFPPYRSSSLAWIENILGGLLFGIGMTLASGCGNKSLIRLGGGNLKSVVVVAIIAVIAYFMINPFPDSDKTLYSLLFYNWTHPLEVSLATGQDIGSLLGGNEKAVIVRLVVGLILAAGLLFFVWKSVEFRASFDNILGGVVVGLAVLAFWYLSSNIGLDVDGDQYTLQGFAQEWDFLAESSEGKPAITAALAPQSFTFINPMGQSLGLALEGFNPLFVTAGVMAFFGIIIGSLIWTLISRSFRIEWFVNLKDFFNHVAGAILMGFGGVLALGCTIGQGITGISTLAVGSFLTFVSIIFGSALTMKIQYYRLVYEGEATFASTLLTALVDMKLLPAALRKHETV